MAAGTWTFYNATKHKLGIKIISLSADTFKMGLYTSGSNAATATLSTKGSLTSECASGNGYAAGGKTLTSVTWGAGTSAGQQKFNAANISWKASGGTIANVKHAVIYDNTAGASAGARPLVLHVALSTSQFTVASGNTLQINAPSGGIFTAA